jgi:3-hydroxyisobutyrate dehydrogenase-like beta-hydroxyacid dehydrogenase
VACGFAPATHRVAGEEEAKLSIAVIGLGQMGRAMAERLAARGFELRVWNRTRDKAAGMRATVCDSPAEAARGAELALTSLSADPAVRAVVLGRDGLLDGLGEGAVHVGTSTISYQLAGELARIHAERGRAYVAAPVLGRPDAAASGRLFVLAGGEERARQRCRALFDAISQGSFDFADAPRANLAKLVANMMIGGIIELLGEVMALGEKGGIPPGRVLDLLTGTLFGCPAIEGYGRRIAERSFEPAGFPMALGLKDVELALAAGHDLTVPLPAANVVRDHMLAALARGLQRFDWSGLTAASRAEAGLG